MRPPWWALAATALLAALISCTQRPDEPTFENPFDPAGPERGDPFHVTATLTAAGVQVSWRDLKNTNVSVYEVHRAAAASGPFVKLTDVPLPSQRGANVTYLDANFGRARSNYYRVLARNAAGDVTSGSLVTAARVSAPPTVDLADTVRSRLQQVVVRADAGDSVQVALTRDFAAPISAERDSNYVLFLLDLGPAANGESRKVYARARTAGQNSPIDSASTVVFVDPRLRRLSDPVLENPVRFQLHVEGIDEIRSALRRQDLANAPGHDPDPTDTLEVVEESIDLIEGVTDTQHVFVESRSDFGLSRIDSFAVVPDTVAPTCSGVVVCFAIEGGAVVTPRAVVRLDMSMEGASRMRFAEDEFLDAIPWQPYAPTYDFTLSAGVGLKKVYGQFANAFDQFGQAAVDSIERVAGAIAPLSSPGRRP